MKPRLIDRLLLGLILLVFIAMMGFLIVCAVGVFTGENIAYFFETLFGPEKKYLFIRIGAAVLCGILAIIAIKLLFTSSKPREKDSGVNASLLMSDENGVAYISAASIDSMAQKYVKSNSRIRECQSKVTIAPDSTVSMTLKAIVLADTNVPELCEKVRTELKDYIETYAGVTVSQITFVVVNTYSPAAATRVN